MEIYEEVVGFFPDSKHTHTEVRIQVLKIILQKQVSFAPHVHSE